MDFFIRFNWTIKMPSLKIDFPEKLDLSKLEKLVEGDPNSIKILAAELLKTQSAINQLIDLLRANGVAPVQLDSID